MVNENAVGGTSWVKELSKFCHTSLFSPACPEYNSGGRNPISYPEFSGFLVSRWAPGETLGTLKKFEFFDWLLLNALHCFTAEILR